MECQWSQDFFILDIWLIQFKPYRIWTQYWSFREVGPLRFSWNKHCTQLHTDNFPNWSNNWIWISWDIFFFTFSWGFFLQGESERDDLLGFPSANVKPCWCGAGAGSMSGWMSGRRSGLTVWLEVFDLGNMMINRWEAPSEKHQKNTSQKIL